MAKSEKEKSLSDEEYRATLEAMALMKAAANIIGSIPADEPGLSKESARKIKAFQPHTEAVIKGIEAEIRSQMKGGALQNPEALERQALFAFQSRLQEIIAGKWPITISPLKSLGKKISRYRDILPDPSFPREQAEEVLWVLGKIFDISSAFEKEKKRYKGEPEIIETIKEQFRKLALKHLDYLEIRFGRNESETGDEKKGIEMKSTLEKWKPS